jgi:hypothetical protein
MEREIPADAVEKSAIDSTKQDRGLGRGNLPSLSWL